jgi:hypothetical protein
VSDEYDIYDVGKAWLPDEARGIIKVSAVADNMGFVSLHFDDEYELYLSKGSLATLLGIVNQSINSLESFDRLKASSKDARRDKGNVLQFKKKDKDNND